MYIYIHYILSQPTIQVLSLLLRLTNWLGLHFTCSLQRSWNPTNDYLQSYRTLVRFKAEGERGEKRKKKVDQNHFSAFMNYVYDSTTMKMPSKPNATYMSDKAWALSIVEGRVKCHFIWFCCWSLTWGRYLLLSTSQVSTLVSSSWDDVRTLFWTDQWRFQSQHYRVADGWRFGVTS